MKKELNSVILLKSALSRSGGLEKYTKQIAEEFVKEGKKVTILTTQTPPSAYKKAGIEVVNFPSSQYFSFSKVLDFDRSCHFYLKSNPASTIFGLDRNRFQTHYRAGNGVHAAYLKKRSQEEGWLKQCSFFCNPLHRTLLHFEKTTFEHPELKLLLTNSVMVKDEILDHYRVDPKKIHVVHNGVEWEQMATPFKLWPEEKGKHCQRLGLDPNSYQFLFLGHNYRRKGLEKLLEALALLKPSQVQLSVVGHDRSFPHFQKMAHRLKIEHQVFFFGKQDCTIPFYQIADSLVIPSFYDPFANVTVEALSMGLFVISSSHNGGKEILSEENGKIIPNLNDIESFAAVLEQATSFLKTRERAIKIRQSVAHLDFSYQLRKVSQLTFYP